MRKGKKGGREGEKSAGPKPPVRTGRPASPSFWFVGTAQHLERQQGRYRDPSLITSPPAAPLRETTSREKKKKKKGKEEKKPFPLLLFLTSNSCQEADHLLTFKIK